MGKRRKHVFVLLFVLGLIVVSALVIAGRETKLGLDLKGGVQLVLQGRPTPQQPTIDNTSMERAVDIIRSGCDQLGVSEIEVSRVGSDQIQVGIPGATSVGKATECATKPARLFFFDWEPNLIGRERVIGGHPGKEPPKGVIAEASEEWKEAGRTATKPSDQQLLFAGAYPTEYAAAKLAAEQKPRPNCENCSQPTTYYLFEKAEPHKLIDGPEFTREDLYISPSGRKRPANAGLVVKVPEGTIVVSEKPQNSKGEVLENAEPGWFALKDDPALSGTEITSPKQETDETGAPNVTFKFTDSGRQAFQEVTRQIAQRGAASAIGPSSAESAEATSGHFAVILDNEVKTRPIINYAQNPDGIDGRTGAQISGGFNSIEDAQELASFLQRGALPINLNLISQSQVSATLGSEALHDGIKAGVIGLLLVVLFLLVFYRFLGLIATLALGAYGVIFFALIKLIPITLTLPGIAGLILTIGVTADANIVIFERIKEEVRAGRSMSNAIAAGYRRGIATIIDANVVTLLTAFVLFVLATAGVKGFAFVLGVGTIVSLLTAVVFTQALLGSMSRSRLLRSPSVLGATRQGVRWHFDFMGASRWFFTLSGCILIIGALALATKQLNLGIDFKSGTRVEVALVKQTNEEAVREALQGSGVSGGEVQKVSNPGLGNNAYLIQSKTLEPSQINELQHKLDKEFGVAPNGFNSTSVGPTFGTTVANSARNALIFSLLIICAYIAFRFDPKFAVPVLIALFHDILITAGIYSLTGREVTSGTVAAFLTILGYSLYDTIIVFDRIRENMPRMPRAAFSQIVNRSMSEVLTRSLATSFTTLLAVVSLLIFGSATLQDFAFAMMVGIASGTYSSIFIASPVLTAWKEREPGFIRRRERIAAVEGRVPAFADEIELARIGEDGEDGEETDAEIEAEIASKREERPKAGAVAMVEPPVEGEGEGGKPSSNGEPPAADPAEIAKREREERRRSRRQQRRKHGRNR
ncbi:MAG TPA: protein translocase subunit SecD [Solirubrobacterales bacterium]